MDVINLLPSPPHLFRLFFKLAFSLFNSTVNTHRHRATVEHPRQVHFDVDVGTGFFPRKPLPHLMDEYEIWEEALAKANGNLSLGAEQSEEAVKKRTVGESWRSDIRMVNGVINFMTFLTDFVSWVIVADP